MTVGSLGRCEKHQLPLDRRGECELCRLSQMASAPPRSRGSLWIALAVGALVLGGGAFAFASFSRFEPVAPARGVPGRSTPPPSTARNDEPSGPDRALPSTPQPVTPSGVPEASVPGEVVSPPAPPATAPIEPSITEAEAQAALRQVRIEMYATEWCDSCRRAREYLRENDIAYTEYDIERDESAKRRLAEINPPSSTPTFRIDDIVQVGFSPEGFEQKLNEAVRRRLY